MSHGDVVEALAPLGFDRATLYRVLIDLVGAGLATRKDVDHVWRFELIRDGMADHDSEHAHFLCTACGAVSCLPDGVVRVVATRSAPRAIERGDIDVQIKGRCDPCSRRTSSRV
jgi:Fur family ferric uptake transcriptional regulator